MMTEIDIQKHTNIHTNKCCGNNVAYYHNFQRIRTHNCWIHWTTRTIIFSVLWMIRGYNCNYIFAIELKLKWFLLKKKKKYEHFMVKAWTSKANKTTHARIKDLNSEWIKHIKWTKYRDSTIDNDSNNNNNKSNEKWNSFRFNSIWCALESGIQWVFFFFF